MPLSPVLREQATYPFVRLAQAAAEREASGLEVIDFGTGDPQDVALPLHEERAFLPALEAVDEDDWARAALERARASYAAKRLRLAAALESAGVRIAGGTATMYLWAAFPAGETPESFASRLLEHGILVAPGPYLGPSGEGYVRLALVPTLEECDRAASILEDVL